MAHVAEMVLLLLLIYVVDFCQATPQQNVTVKSGEDVHLQCRGPRGAAVTVKWSRSDLESDKYVFFFRDERSYKGYQLPSFRGRVELRDPEMKDGDVSVVLKNVTVNDSGTYECRVSAASRRRKRNTPEPNSTIKLTVTHSAGHNEGGGTEEEGNADEANEQKHFGLLATLIVVVMMVFGFFFWKRQRSVKKSSEQPAEEADDQQRRSRFIRSTP